MADPLNKYSRLNPVPNRAALPESTWTDTALLEVIDERARPRQGRKPAATRRKRGWKGPLVAAAAFGFVLIAGLLVLLLFEGRNEVPPADSVPEGWIRIVDDEAFPRRDGQPEISSITFGGPGLVAVGSDRTPFGEGPTEGTAPTTLPPGAPGDDAAVWVSADGISWSRVPHDDEVFGGPEDQRMNDVVAGGPGLVAVGGGLRLTAASTAASTSTGSLVWVSSDGMTWSRVHDEPGPTMIAVTTGGPGLVAVGSDESGAAVLTSNDGITWSRVSDAEGVFRTALLYDVTVGPSGLIAVGREGSCAADDDCQSVVWTSADGVTWTRVYSDVGEGMTAVAQAGPGLVAVGWGGAVWTSPDGINWTRQPGIDLTSEASDSLAAVTRGGLGVVVASQAGWGASAMWTSPDGVTWSRIEDDGLFFAPGLSATINDMILTDHGLMVVGSDSRWNPESQFQDGRDAAAVWIWDEGG